jgi:hypothetical protein
VSTSSKKLAYLRRVKLQNQIETTHQKASFLKALKTICWAYLGVRSKRGYEEDIATITLGQTITIGILVWLAFVLSVASVAIYVSR